jgi:hypothetical protein
MFRKLVFLLLAATAVSAIASTSFAAESKFVFRYKAGTTFTSGGSGGPAGTESGSETGGEGSGDDGSGSAGGDDGNSEGAGGDGQDSGDEDGSGEAGDDDAGAQRYALQHLHTGFDNPDVGFADGAKAPVTSFTILPMAPFRLGDVLTVCWDTEQGNFEPLETVFQFGGDGEYVIGAGISGEGIREFDIRYDPDMNGGLGGTVDEYPQRFSANSGYGCLDIKTGERAGTPPGSLNLEVHVAYDGWGYPGAGWEWGSRVPGSSHPWETFLYSYYNIVPVE